MAAKQTLLPDDNINSTDDDDYIFQATVMFSVIKERKSMVTISWKKWCSTLIKINKSGRLLHQVTVGGSFDVSGAVSFTLMEDNVNNITMGDVVKEFGIVVKNRSADGHDTYFRLLLNQSDFADFNSAVSKVATSVKIDDFLQQSNYTKEPRISTITLNNAPNTRESLDQQSAMRKSIMRAMDKFDKRSTKEKVIAKRGALHWLPVRHWRNDLIHGSWWFIIGSVLFMLSSIIVVINSDINRIHMGTDDSILNEREYDATWVLMSISGFFYTLGSVAFMRAVHEDPPMRPLSSWYHFQSDELLGSWFFVFGTLPFIPYCLIYLSASDGSYEYFGALIIVILGCLGCLLFVRGCYPTGSSEVARRQFVQPCLHCFLYCCCTKRFLERHLANDWLTGTWIILIGTILAVIGSFMALVYYLAVYNSLLVYIFATGLVYNIAFMIGSAYFVAGSYEELLVDRPYQQPNEKDDRDAEVGGNAL
jgi:hypothetical protein